MKIKIKEKPQNKEVKEIFNSLEEPTTETEKVPETEEKPSVKEETTKEVEQPMDTGTALTQVAKDTKVPTIKEVVKTALDDLNNTEVTKGDLTNQTEKMIEKVNQSAVIHTIRTNEDVQKGVLESAD